MITKILLAGGALVALSGDTETIDITSSTLEVLLDTAAADPVCASYQAVDDAVAALPVDAEAQAMFRDMADAYLLIMLEGETLRLTPEARDLFTTWLHVECA